MVQSPPVKPGYRPQADDTSIETDAVYFMLLRDRTAVERLEMGDGMMADARRLSLHCLQQRHGALPLQDFARKVAIAWLQDDCPPHYIPSGTAMTWIQNSTDLAAQLHRILTGLNIPYYITGGVAAIAYGEPRTTRDLDIVLEVPRSNLDQSRSNLDPLAQALETEGFLVSGLEDAQSGRLQSLGITHIATIARADLIIAGDSAYERLRFERSRVITLPGTGDLMFSSPEDVILSKLQWGKRSQSEKQWRDVLAVMKVQDIDLDFAYLRQWGPELGIAEDLERAFTEAGI